MPRTQRSELKAGVIALVALGALIGVVLWLGAADVFRPVRSRAAFFIEESDGSAGLSVGSFVQFGDDPVGQIAEIRYLPEKRGTLYLAEIEREGVAIRADGEAHVTAGLVGGGNLTVTNRGSPDSPPADEDHPIRIVGRIDKAMGDIAVAAESFKDITAIVKQELDPTRAEALLGKIHAIASKVRTAAADVAQVAAHVRGEADPDRADSMLARIRRSTDDITRITGNLSKETDAKQAGSLLAKVHGTVDEVKGMATEARPQVKKVLADASAITANIRAYSGNEIRDILVAFRQTSTEILKASRDLATVSGQAREIVVLNRDSIDRTIDNLAMVSGNLKAASADIRRNPWKLLRQPKKEQLHAEGIASAARSFSSGARQLDQTLARLTALAQARPKGIAPDDPQLAKIRRQLDEVFTKFTAAEKALWEQLEE